MKRILFMAIIALSIVGPAEARKAEKQPIVEICDNNGRCLPGQPGVAAPSQSAYTRRSSGGATNDRACLTADTRSILERAEEHFGVTFKLASTCRPGAKIAGTNYDSEHAFGRAVDLLVPRGTSKAEVVQWFYRNAKGVTMVYRGMAHVHFDTGPFHKLACGGCGGGRKRHARVAHLAR